MRSARRARAKTGRRRVLPAPAALAAPGRAASVVRGRQVAGLAVGTEDSPPAPADAIAPRTSGRRLRGPKKGQQQEHKPRGPIKEKATGRIYAVDDVEDDAAIDIDNVATRAPKDLSDEAATDDVMTDNGASPAQDDGTDDQE